MKPRILVGALMAFAAAAPAPCAEYPLTFKTVDVVGTNAIPGNAGRFGSLSLTKPRSLRNEPKPVSSHPLYCQLNSQPGSPQVIVRLDESKGDGSGYDQLLVDCNSNGDLADDLIILRAANNPMRSSSINLTMDEFGPIKAPAETAPDGQSLLYYAQVLVDRRSIAKSSDARRTSSFIGQIRLRAGWYAEASVTLDGKNHKLGFLDANANFKLADRPKSQSFRRANSTTPHWAFTGGDSWLRDLDGSGKFDTRNIRGEDSYFGSIVYFGTTPCRVRLRPDSKAVIVEPWAGETGEIQFDSQGASIEKAVLAWQESEGGDWHLIEPAITKGKARVPVGNYRLYETELSSAEAKGPSYGGTATLSACGTPLRVSANQSVAIVCGGPLKAALSSRKSGSSADTILLQAELIGSGGETYSNFFSIGPRSGRPPPPKYTITTKDGNELESGNMEYG